MRKMICRFFSGSCMLGWMAVIFCFSAQPAVESSEVSGTLAYHIVSFADEMLNRDLTGWQKEIYAEMIHSPLRKAAHMTEYAVLCILCFAFLKSMGTRGWRIYFFSFGISALYAALDEIHQFFVAGRSCSFMDILIDASGAAVSMLLCFAVSVCILKRKR